MSISEIEFCERCNQIVTYGGGVVPQIDYRGTWHLYCSEACRDGVISGEEPDIVY